MRLDLETPPPAPSAFREPRSPWARGRQIGDPHLLAIGVSFVIAGVRLILEVTPFAWGLGAARAPGMFAVRGLCVLFNVSRVRRA